MPFTQIFLHSLAIGFAFHPNSVNQSLFGFFIAMVICIFPSLIILAMSYGNIAIYLCLDRKIRKESVLINLLKDKLKSYCKLYFLVNLVIPLLYTIYFDWGYLVVGVSYILTTLIFGVVFNISISRYFTPGVFAVIGKIKEILSPSAPVTVEK